MPSIPSIDLIKWVKETPLPWLYFDSETGRLTFIIDNHLLSTYRSCASYFMLAHVEGWRRKSMGGAEQREWALDFGILFHKMMEVYYKHFRDPNFNVSEFAINWTFKAWQEAGMDIHLGHKECQALGGYPGLAAMLIHYATQFSSENEHFRVLASEVAFGRNKEVPIYNDSLYNAGPHSYANIYLSGRIDLPVDDGFRIFPIDHKTMGSFRGDPLERFVIDDGPTGYIYALNRVLPLVVPEELILKRECNQIQMNLISKAVPKEGSRFKRLIIRKTTKQLEAYRQRVIATCNHLLEDLELYIRGLSVPRDTSKCSNWYFRTCPFHDVHRQADRAAEQATLQNGYIQLPIWNTETVGQEE